jgi:hypothetical protein
MNIDFLCGAAFLAVPLVLVVGMIMNFLHNGGHSGDDPFDIWGGRFH